MNIHYRGDLRLVPEASLAAVRAKDGFNFSCMLHEQLIGANHTLVKSISISS